jgi:hypothetical protein
VAWISLSEFVSQAEHYCRTVFAGDVLLVEIERNEDDVAGIVVIPSDQFIDETTAPAWEPPF